METAVRIQNLSVIRDGNLILDKVSASVPLGSSTAIVGPNGAGKTTLLLALLGELQYQGTIQIGDATSGLRIAYVPQRLTFDRNMPLTVMEYMVLNMQRLPIFLWLRSTAKAKARELLGMVGMASMEKHKLGALSGGETQRLLLALALGEKPELLILDEPASGVDYQGEHVFCELLESQRKRWGFTQLMVSHDLATVTHHADHVICLNRKVAAEGKPREVLTPNNLAAVFGIHMGLVEQGSLNDDHSHCAHPQGEHKKSV